MLLAALTLDLLENIRRFYICFQLRCFATEPAPPLVSRIRFAMIVGQ